MPHTLKNNTMKNNTSSTDKNAPLTIVKIHDPQIPTGEARTGGYGTTRLITVVLCNAAFSDFRSPKSTYRILKSWGTVRTDYGTQRGHAAQVYAEAHAFAEAQRA